MNLNKKYKKQKAIDKIVCEGVSYRGQEGVCEGITLQGFPGGGGVTSKFCVLFFENSVSSPVFHRQIQYGSHFGQFSNGWGSRFTIPFEIQTICKPTYF